MSLNDQLSNVLSHILNCERVGKAEAKVKGSKIIKECLKILKSNNYIKEFNVTPTQQGEIIDIKLSGNINKCNVIKPTYSVKVTEFEKFEKRFLPAKDFGIIIVSTSKGIMTHKQAIDKKLGGRLIAYCY